jgi:outer membrane protein assembly factor BamB
MRALLALIVLAVAGAAGLVTYALVTRPAPEAPPLFSASTRPADSAVERPSDADIDAPLVEDLSKRPGSDWPIFLGPNCDGKSPEVGLQPWPKDGPRIVWEGRLGQGYSPPTICRGRLLVADNTKQAVFLYCLNAETGEELWSYRYVSSYVDRFGYANAPRACPITDGRRVYLHGADGILFCFRLRDGKLLWKVDTITTFGIVPNFFGVASVPVLDGDRLLVHIGGSPAGSDDRDFMNLKSNGSCIVAFDKATGKILYQGGDELASYATPQLVTLNGTRTGLILARGGLLGFDPNQGKQLFHFPFRSRLLESVNASNVVVAGNQVFLTESYGAGCALVTIENNMPELVWSSPTRRRDTGLCCHWNTPILIDGHLYGCSGRHQNEAELRCVDFATGQVKWKVRPTRGDTVMGRGSLTYADGHFFYLAEEGVLFLIKVNPKRYEEVAVWDGRKKIPDHPLSHNYLMEPCWAAPVLSRGLLYLRGEYRLVCLEVIPATP